MKNRKLIFSKWLKDNLRTDEQIAGEHREADMRCGREWECACPPCRKV